MSKLFVISAPSGAGKTSLIESLLENSPLKNLKLGISCTTREKRENEVNGESYFFTTKNEFIEMYKNGDLLGFQAIGGGLSWGSAIVRFGKPKIK